MDNLFESLGEILRPEQSKHTPGEWKCSPVMNFSDMLVSYINAGEQPIAQLRGLTTGQEEEAEANAKLIASAPALLSENKKLKEINGELLEALKECMEYFEYMGGKNHAASRGAREKTKSAIEKASKNINK